MSNINVPEEIKEKYDKWRQVMDSVQFGEASGDTHTKEHSSRVLVYILLMAKEIQLTENELRILATCAAFHDSQRHNDGYDVGHGRRSAEYYKQYCQSTGADFDQWAFDIMAYHDRQDSLGIRAMIKDTTGREIQLYRIFKDADALDRVRNGANEVNTKMLRTSAAKDLYKYAIDVLMS